MVEHSGRKGSVLHWGEGGWVKHRERLGWSSMGVERDGSSIWGEGKCQANVEMVWVEQEELWFFFGGVTFK